MRDLKESEKALRELLAQRILVLDGAMGTMLQQRNLSAADFGGPRLKVATRTWCSRGLTWSSIFTANITKRARTLWRPTRFGSTPLVLAEYGLQAAPTN